MNTLQEVWDNLAGQGYKSDKGDVHSYLPVYEEILRPYRVPAKNVLEVGLFRGDSFRMWEQYFSFGTRVYGIDCDIRPHGGMADLTSLIQEKASQIFIMDAANQNEVEQSFGDTMFDVIIEDAGHDLMQQLQIYYNLKNHISKGGIYIIEDIQDIDANRSFFEALDPEKKIEIIDRRHINGRYDDCLVIITDK